MRRIGMVWNMAGMADLDAQIAGFCAELGIEAPV